MYDFIINAPISPGPVMPIWLPVIGGFPINSPLVGSFLGVFLGFIVNYIYQYIKNFNDRIYYRDNIKSELELCIKRLEKVGNLLPVDRWISIRNSGALKFFSRTEVDNLSRAYEAIQNNNYEAKRVRDLAEEYKKFAAISFSLEDSDVKRLKALWDSGSENLESKRIILQKGLQESKDSLQEKGLELYLRKIKLRARQIKNKIYGHLESCFHEKA
jgi:RNAse (barnase) inhibitor barstar